MIKVKRIPVPKGIFFIFFSCSRFFSTFRFIESLQVLPELHGRVLLPHDAPEQAMVGSSKT